MKHHRLATRRDFLSQGLIAFGATISLPSWANALANCSGDEGALSSMPAYLVFDMAGGAGLPGNFLVGKEGGPEDYLAKYDLLGWNPKESGALNSDFGLPMSAKYSKILEGILANSSVEARKNLRMGSLCHFAQDDSSSNRLNSASLAVSAGLKGKFVGNGIGIVNSASGGNSAPTASGSAYKSVYVKSVTDIFGMTNFGGDALKEFEIAQKIALVNGSIAMSQSQTADYAQMIDGQILAEQSECAYSSSSKFLTDVSGLDPRTDTQTQAVYNINQNSGPTDQNVLAAALVMNSLKGNSGPSTWTLGGCDYHDGTQASGDAKDLDMGVQIGRAVQLAFQLKKPLFFQILTDGGVFSGRGNRNWNGDSGDKCMTIVGFYDPKGPRNMIRQQVGYYTDGQGAERNTLIGSEPMLVGYAVLANYLNICGRLGEFASLAPGVFDSNAKLQSVLLFEGPKA